MKECEGHIHDLEKENLDLHQKLNVDKKTLATLRQVCTKAAYFNASQTRAVVKAVSVYWIILFATD